MKQSFLAGLTLALGALAVLMGTAASAEDTGTTSSVNEVVPDDVATPNIMSVKH